VRVAERQVEVDQADVVIWVLSENAAEIDGQRRRANSAVGASETDRLPL
jgi:hypothetical protein